MFRHSSFAAALLCIASPALMLAQSIAPLPGDHARDRAQRYFVQGGRAVQNGDLKTAVDAFGKAAALEPKNRNYDAALAIAKDNLATELMQQALKARLEGHSETFKLRMREAAALDSRNPLVMQHIGDLAEDAEDMQTQPALPYAQAAPPVVLEPEPGRHSFHTRLASPELLRTVLNAWGISCSIGSSVGTGVVPFDADNVSFNQALNLLTLATGTFVVRLDPHRVLIALDTKQNRSNFERLAVETLFLPGLSPNELSDVSNIARNLFAAQHVTISESKSTVTLRAPERQMQAFNYQIQQLLDGGSEVMLEVDMYEVQRQHMVNEGAQLPQTSSIFNVDSEVQSLLSSNSSLVQQIISSGLASPNNFEEIALALVASGEAGSTILSQPFAYFGGGITTTGVTLNSVAANLQLNDSDTRMLDQVQLRLEDQQEGTLKVGERYPIVTSSYSNLATGATAIPGISSAGLSTTLQNLGVSLASLNSATTASVPQVQYQDIGLTLTATPRVEAAGNISLKVHFQLSSLSGQSLNSNPVINNRQSDSTLMVRPGEKTVLVSQLSQQESSTLIGLPFLSEIPGFEIGTNREINNTSDSLVIIITPHLVRLGHTKAESRMVLLPTHS